jgi:hypothetical protein
MKKYEINRRKFLAQSIEKSVVFLTVPAFLQACASHYPRQIGKSGDDPLLNAREAGLRDPILQAINVAITAPNPHNTQAWKFKIISPTEMLLYVDAERILPMTDPTTRQIHIGQGSFLEVLGIGAAHLGYQTRITLLPEGDYAISEIGKKPVARVELFPESNVNKSLYETVSKRRTDRSEYIGEFINKAEAQQIIEQVKPMHTKVAFILDKAAIQETIALCFEGMKTESYTYRTNDETRGWFRFSDKEIQAKRDGLALPDQGVSGFSRWMAETFFMGPEPEKFHDRSGLDNFLSGYKTKIESARGLVYWITETNTKKDWIQTGYEYARLQLVLTKMGLVMHPMSQILQEYDEMAELRQKFEKMMNIKGPQKIQMLARLGRSNYDYFSPRRNIQSMLKS